MSSPPAQRRALPPLDPEAIWADVWCRLGEAVGSARHPFHLAVFATLRDGAPEQRTVVLRGVDPQRHQTTFHTDLRSPKAADLAKPGPASWLFYDATTRVQLRLRGTAELVHRSEEVDRRWQNSRLQSQSCYRHLVGPGSHLDSPLDYLPDKSDSGAGTRGRQHFAIVVTQIISLEWLSLHHAGHRRLRFTIGDRGVDSTWLAP
ncbi:MAG: pyridoxamine 5'-phosphate oxidase family protein [Pseudomonadota bacterium]